MNDPQMTWSMECQIAVVRLAGFLAGANRHVTGFSIVEVLRQLPRSLDPEQEMPDDNLFMRCLMEISKCDELKGEYEEFKLFLRRLAEMPSDRRKLLEESIEGVILGAGMVDR